MTAIEVPWRSVRANGLILRFVFRVWEKKAAALVAVAAVSVASGWWRLGIAIGIAGSLALRSIMHALMHQEDRPPLGGVLASRTHQPRLFALLDRVHERIGIARKRFVVVTPDCTVAAGSGTGNHAALGIGFWLLAGLPEDEVEVMIVTEVARASLYRKLGVRKLRRVQAELDERVRLSHRRKDGALSRFARRVDRSVYLLVASRHRTLVHRATQFGDQGAERAAAAASSTGTVASSALRSAYVRHLVDERFWPAVWGASRAVAEPPDGIFETMTALLTDRLSNGGSHACDGVHRVVTDRQLARLSAQLSARWRRAASGKWSQYHSSAMTARGRLDQLQTRADSDRLSVEEAVELAILTDSLGTRAEARTRYEEVVAARPADPQANFGLGRLLLEEDDDHGLFYLGVAMIADEQAVPAACAIAVRYLEQTGRANEARAYRERRDRLPLRASIRSDLAGPWGAR